jgi:D-alanyl-D-alanine carboxypeptidase (penicillin-binding protein 5/6)
MSPSAPRHPVSSRARTATRRRLARAGAVVLAAVTLLTSTAMTASASDAQPIGGPLLGGSGVVANTAPGVAAPPNVDLTSYVLADATTGQVLAAKAPHERLYPASCQKVLMALVVMPLLRPTQKLVATQNDLSPEPDGSAVGIEAGLTYTVADLWHGVFLRSGNDAVQSLSNMVGGPARVVAMMRAEAHKLQADDTTVTDADGYDQPGQLSSAYDLALMARAGLRDPEFVGYSSMHTARFPGEHGSTFEIDTENRLMGVYPGLIGVKNGYTTLAGHTYIGAATRDGHTLIVSVMHGGMNIYAEAAQLLDWGFAADGRVKPVGELVGDLRPGHPGAPPTASYAVLSNAANSGAVHSAGAAGGSPTGAVAGVVGGAALLGTGYAALRARRRTVRRRTEARRARRESRGGHARRTPPDDIVH